jgi:AcrR family transcriptional regulator
MTCVIMQMGMGSSARQRMIQSAAVLMRERGGEGTSFSEVLAHSGAPRGSIYHHFPGGKAQLVEEATRFAGDYIADGMTLALQADDPLVVIDGITAMFRPILMDSDYAAGCPVVAGTLEGSRIPGARDAAGDAFRRWEETLTTALIRRNVPEEQARSLSTLVFAAAEGAIIMSRAQRSLDPLERVATELKQLLRNVLEQHAG